MEDQYILRNKEAVPTSWEEYLAERDKGREDKRVAKTILPNGKWISTVFLGLNHQYGDGPPLLFESMAFPAGGKYSEIDCERYSTWEEAEAGHKKMVEAHK